MVPDLAFEVSFGPRNVMIIKHGFMTDRHIEFIIPPDDESEANVRDFIHKGILDYIEEVLEVELKRHPIKKSRSS